jgi:hypothetical protein
VVLDLLDSLRTRPPAAFAAEEFVPVISHCNYRHDRPVGLREPNQPKPPRWVQTVKLALRGLGQSFLAGGDGTGEGGYGHCERGPYRPDDLSVVWKILLIDTLVLTKWTRKHAGWTSWPDHHTMTY